MDILLREPLFDGRGRVSAERISCASLGFQPSPEIAKERQLVAEKVIRREREKYAVTTVWNFPQSCGNVSVCR